MYLYEAYEAWGAVHDRFITVRSENRQLALKENSLPSNPFDSFDLYNQHNTHFTNCSNERWLNDPCSDWKINEGGVLTSEEFQTFRFTYVM